jgi:hypothetical protein
VLDWWEEEFVRRPGSASEGDGATLARSFLVAMTTTADTAKEVISQLGLFVGAGAAKVGYPHPSHAAAYCTDMEADPDAGHPLLWHVTATYKEPKPPPGEDPQQPEAKPPDEQPPQVSTDTEPVESFDVLDWSPLPVLIVNAAGDQFDPPLVTYDGVSTITVKRWYRAVDLVAVNAFANCVNSSPLQTVVGEFPRHGLLLHRLATSPETKRGWHGRAVTMTLKYKPLPPAHMRPKEGSPFHPMTGGWVPTCVLNSGWAYLNDDDVKVTAMDDAGKSPVNNQVLLDADGKKLPAGGTPIYLHFQQYQEADLSWVFT